MQACVCVCVSKIAFDLRIERPYLIDWKLNCTGMYRHGFLTDIKCNMHLYWSEQPVPEQMFSTNWDRTWELSLYTGRLLTQIKLMEFGALFTESCRELKLVGRGPGSECVFRTSLGIPEGCVYFPWGTGNPCALSVGLSGESSSSTSLITTFCSRRWTARFASRGGLNHQDGKTQRIWEVHRERIPDFVRPASLLYCQVWR